VKIAVTPKEILQLVQKGADDRLGETVERMLLILRYHHTHQSWRKECSCEYCQFINGEYVKAKLKLHQIKKRINRIDYWACADWEMTLMPQLVVDQLNQKCEIHVLKKHKKELQENII